MSVIPTNPRRLASGLMRRFGAATQVRFAYPLKIGRSWFRVPVIDGVGAGLLAAHERWFSKVVGLLLRDAPDALFVDIGANVGQTLLKVRGEHPHVPYVAFEPNPHCVHYLHELIRANPSLHGVVVYPVGLADRTQVIGLLVEYDTDSQGTVVRDFRRADSDKHQILVALVDAASVTHFTAERYIIKIDVEGGELDVLNGLDSLLRERRPPVICEVLPAYSPERTVRVERQQQLEQRLRDWRYAAVRLPTKEKPSVVSEFGIHSNLDWSNYALVPSERQDLIDGILALDLGDQGRVG